MSKKIKLTKNELKKQKDSLKRFNLYLPTLLLKKKQLQVEILRMHREIDEVKKNKAYLKAKVYEWVDVFNEKVGLEKLIRVEKIMVGTGNIAGIDIPIFEKVEFFEEKYDLKKIPLWVDSGIEALKKVMILNAKTEILKKQDILLNEELRITTQRVNLFEKVMIPEAKENVRRIQIYLGDMDTAAVVTGKIAKAKILRR